MAEANRSFRINELENQLHGLEFLLHQLGPIQEEEISSFLSETNYVSKQEIESTLMAVSQLLRKAKGEPKAGQAENDKKALKTAVANPHQEALQCRATTFSFSFLL